MLSIVRGLDQWKIKKGTLYSIGCPHHKFIHYWKSLTNLYLPPLVPMQLSILLLYLHTCRQLLFQFYQPSVMIIILFYGTRRLKCLQLISVTPSSALDGNY